MYFFRMIVLILLLITVVGSNSLAGQKPSKIIDESLLPTYKDAQIAYMCFNEQTSLYAQSVVIGESLLVEQAETKANDVRKSINNILNLKGLNPEYIRAFHEISSFHNDYSALAKQVYMNIISEPEPEAAIEKNRNNMVIKLTRDAFSIKEKLLKQIETLYFELNDSILNANKAFQK